MNLTGKTKHVDATTKSYISYLLRVNDTTAWPLKRNNRRRQEILWQATQAYHTLGHLDALVEELEAMQPLGSGGIQQHCSGADHILPPS